ncbi:MAG: hypothetical protein AAFS00_11545 [Bacteroidota bacterium]
MKKFLYGTTLLGVIFVFTSCGERCTTCTYSYELGGQAVELTQPEICGNRALINETQDAAQQAAEDLATFNGGTNATATCVDSD